MPSGYSRDALPLPRLVILVVVIVVRVVEIECSKGCSIRFCGRCPIISTGASRSGALGLSRGRRWCPAPCSRWRCSWRRRPRQRRWRWWITRRCRHWRGWSPSSTSTHDLIDHGGAHSHLAKHILLLPRVHPTHVDHGLPGALELGDASAASASTSTAASAAVAVATLLVAPRWRPRVGRGRIPVHAVPAR